MTKTYDRWELFLSILVQFIWFGFAFKATSHLLISLVLILPLIVTCSLSLHHFYIVRHVFWKLTPTRFRKLYYFHLLTHCISMDSPDVINPLLNKFKVNSEELAQILNDYLSEEWLNHEVDIWKKWWNTITLATAMWETLILETWKVIILKCLMNLEIF